MLEAELKKERRRNDVMEEELMNVRQRLHTFTRRLIPRRAKRKLRRRIMDDEESTVTAGSDSDTEIEDENFMNDTLVRIMDYDN